MSPVTDFPPGSVELIHGGLEVTGDHGENGVTCPIDGRLNSADLLVGEGGKDVLDLFTLWKLVANADSKARELGRAEPLSDVGEAVVAATAAAGSEAEGADGEVEVVHHNEELLGGQVGLLQEGRDGVPAPIHVGEGKCESNLLLVVRGPTEEGIQFMFERHVEPFSQCIDDLIPDVVTGPFVFSAWIAEPDNEMRRGRHGRFGGGR